MQGERGCTRGDGELIREERVFDDLRETNPRYLIGISSMLLANHIDDRRRVLIRILSQGQLGENHFIVNKKRLFEFQSPAELVIIIRLIRLNAVGCNKAVIIHLFLAGFGLRPDFPVDEIKDVVKEPTCTVVIEVYIAEFKFEAP